MQRSPMSDPWDPFTQRQAHGAHVLTSVEITVTQLCNLRCAHCAVGNSLRRKEEAAFPLADLLRRLDEVETLTTLSLTGGEPIASPQTVQQWVKPLLRYARQRGLQTQINTNLTLPAARYEEDWVADVDVLHISYNAPDVEAFAAMAFAHLPENPHAAQKLWERLHDNARRLSCQGVAISAETFLSPQTAPHIEALHQTVAQLGCWRHEIHPLYPADFAQGAELVSKATYCQLIERLLACHDPKVWLLFGTLPIFPCSADPEEQQLWVKLHNTPHVTVRQDPDGRNRLNLNPFDGTIRLTDFGQGEPLGYWTREGLVPVFQRWLRSTQAAQYHCFCAKARCAGPNALVAQAYYATWDFTQRTAQIAVD